MLGKLETLSLNPSLEALAQAVEDKDYAKMKSKAHSLKGASGYIGASCLHYSCYHIQDQFMANNYEAMLFYYPLLIESAIEFKIESRRILAQKNGNFLTSKVYEFRFNFYVFLGEEPLITSDVETCVVAKGYSIAKHKGKFYCLKAG